MTRWSDLMIAARDASTPRPEVVAAARARVDAALQPATPLLREAPAPSRDAALRVRTRVLQGRPSAVPAPFGWAVGAALAAAAVGVVVLRPAAAEPERVELGAVVAQGPVALSSVLRVEADGSGVATGADRNWQLAWEAGHLHVDVDHGVGAQVRVETREAVVEVVGTVFDVDRDALGTRVEVSRGHVRVHCKGGQDADLVETGAVVCVPTSAAGLLGRAAAQARQGDTPDTVLATLAAAESLQPDDAVRSEILAARLSPLLELGDRAAARATAARYLDEAQAPRRIEVRATAFALALADGDCDAAKALASDAALDQELLRACAGEAP